MGIQAEMKQYVKDNNISVNKLAKKLGVCNTTLHSFLNKPRPGRTLEMVEKFYNIKAEEALDKQPNVSKLNESD